MGVERTTAVLLRRKAWQTREGMGAFQAGLRAVSLSKCRLCVLCTVAQNLPYPPAGGTCLSQLQISVDEGTGTLG